MSHEWWRREERGGEIGGGAKGNRRRITKESDWRRKEVKTKGRMYAFYDNCGMGEEGSRHWRGRIRVGRYRPPHDTVLGIVWRNCMYTAEDLCIPVLEHSGEPLHCK